MSGVSYPGGEAITHRLRETHVQLVHPDDDDARAPLLQLVRIGCPTERVWSPTAVGEGVDAVFGVVSTQRTWSPTPPG